MGEGGWCEGFCRWADLCVVDSVIFASIWRAATMKNLSHVDTTWDNVNPLIWAFIENGVGKLPAGCDWTISRLVWWVVWC